MNGNIKLERKFILLLRCLILLLSFKLTSGPCPPLTVLWLVWSSKSTLGLITITSSSRLKIRYLVIAEGKGTSMCCTTCSRARTEVYRKWALPPHFLTECNHRCATLFIVPVVTSSKSKTFSEKHTSSWLIQFPLQKPLNDNTMIR